MAGNQFIKGSLTAIILKMVEEEGRMYGYEITKKVKESSGGKMNLSEAALYPALHKLVEEGTLKTEVEKVDGRQRKYYLLSPKGKKQVKIHVAFLNEAIETLSFILKPKPSHG